MVQITEGTFKVGDQELYTKTWLPDGPILAKLIFIHGFSDHVNCYMNFFDTLAGRGIAVYGFDQRGWGRSVRKPSDKGRTGPTTTVLEDIGAFIKPHIAEAKTQNVPVFVKGHSMGGNEVAMLMAQPVGSSLEADVVRHVRGWLLEGPFFGWAVGEEPSALKVWSGRLASKFLPNMQLKHIIPASYLSRDPEVVKRIQADDLCHDTGTLEGLAGLLDRTAELADGKRPPGPAVKSLWLGHGTDDLASSYAAAKKWYDTCATNVPDKEFRSYDGWVHQLHAEPLEDRELFYKEVGDWILARSGAGEEVHKAKAVSGPVAEATEAAPASTSAPADEAAPVATEAGTESKL